MPSRSWTKPQLREINLSTEIGMYYDPAQDPDPVHEPSLDALPLAPAQRSASLDPLGGGA